ncbi:hypothetical protein EPO15_15075 [bacterium]|nr:MAG: hypothetical protein EPO15_15075 [bacterium]
MTALLAAFLTVAALPYFMVTWRTALAALSLQGLLMAWMVLERGPASSPEALLSLVDLGLVRGLLAPIVLYRVLEAQRPPRRGDALLPNMLSLATAAALVALAFRFAGRLEPGGGEVQTAVAVSAAALLLALLSLATQTGVFTQAVGALAAENAIALFELGAEGGSTPLPVRLGAAVVFLLSVWLLSLYVRWLPPEAGPEPAGEGSAA